MRCMHWLHTQCSVCTCFACMCIRMLSAVFGCFLVNRPPLGAFTTHNLLAQSALSNSFIALISMATSYSSCTRSYPLEDTANRSEMPPPDSPAYSRDGQGEADCTVCSYSHGTCHMKHPHIAAETPCHVNDYELLAFTDCDMFLSPPKRSNQVTLLSPSPFSSGSGLHVD
jgi:hypothetical protein